MQAGRLQALVGQTDIYLLDQVLKHRYQPGETILDAGCGNGRNLHWFILNDFDCYGIDHNPAALEELTMLYPLVPAGKFVVAGLDSMPFTDGYFDHILSSAVLHFARDTTHFHVMLQELVRVLKPAGTLFIRMTSNIGIENAIVSIGEGVYLVPDGSARFLLTRELLATLLTNYPLTLLEPLKTVNVDDARCMSTLVLQRTDLKN
jgi:ubiquinone/menaquinone biosynthesis C-methylase UbiE